jgi:hypothetical protein
MSDDRPDVVSSLPPQPLPESLLDDLEEHERINSASTVMTTVGGDDGGLVYQFILQIGETYHPLVLDEDGAGWTNLGSTESREEAELTLQASGGAFDR